MRATDAALKAPVRILLVVVICLLAAACARAPAPRPLANGFGAEGGVAEPYADGKRHLAAGNDELAAQRFGQALAHDGRSLDALNGLGVAYTRLGRFDGAETQFERALQIDPTNAATLNNYGWSLIEQGRLREARAFLELARAHGTDAEAPTIAANLEKLQQAQPPALLGALQAGSASRTQGGPHRLIRVADNAYVLETAADATEPPAPLRAARDAPLAPLVVQTDTAAAIDASEEAGAPGHVPTIAAPAQDAGTAAALPDPAQQSGAASEPGVRMRPHTGGAPIRLWPPLASGAEAAPISPGDDR
jgi:tetratricopeptide (TPR) repeat protein